MIITSRGLFMIENLKGLHETVNYKEDSSIRLYDNTEIENYPIHWHTPVEIIMPISSTYEVLCANVKFNLNPYDICLICPGIVHSVGTEDEGERIIFQIDPSKLRQLKGIDYILTEYSPAIIVNSDTPEEIHQSIINIILDIKKEYFSADPYSDINIYSKFLNLLVLLGRNCTKLDHSYDLSSSKNKEMAEKIQYACNYISEHCTEDLNLETVAEIVGFSKFHFARQFKLFTNSSFYKYLTQRRIFMAERLLVESDYSVTDIALQCGFSNISTFIRMFKITNECTPTEFKNKYIKSQNKNTLK